MERPVTLKTDKQHEMVSETLPLNEAVHAEGAKTDTCGAQITKLMEQNCPSKDFHSLLRAHVISHKTPLLIPSSGPGYDIPKCCK